ncbi:hypothetical protein CLOBOL_04824 [Enterocloster bolteae ATCC BAA-613]|uniref:Uncharacterized protein n=1 Tax=Enterocloster bolteae (strain ATCC BAA-613 / DSM 15670 / CCUG 46953 / JCM 12243 / WAL 16351) TaxID=411902 RepID=A8RX91_ENTBW|nr:hypothetical protein CLOBOL_04824 [Enterocloster bolteae ATCC BAA-613]
MPMERKAAKAAMMSDFFAIEYPSLWFRKIDCRYTCYYYYCTVF